jgi:hypothetical protein
MIARLGLLVGLAAVVGSPVAAEARSAESRLTIDVVPQSVAPQPGRSTPVLVIVQNGGEAAKKVTLSWVNAAQARIAVADAQPPRTRVTLPEGAERAWQLMISAPAAVAPGKIFFRVDYTVVGTSHVATAALEVQSATPTKLEDIAAVEVKTTLESLDEQHAGVVYVLVTNKLATPITVVDIIASGPDEVTFRGPTDPVMIGARQTSALEVDVEANDRVRPGKHLLLFNVHLKWGEAPDTQEAHVITTHQTQIGILGESAVLTLLGVPSFLFIPGFLILIAIVILWRFRVLRPATAQDFPFGAKDAEFWAIAITLSVAMGFIYPRVGGVDYLSGAYGLRDVVAIWLISLAIGLASYLFVMGAMRARHARRTPSDRDDETSVIRKLARQNLGLDCPRFERGQAPATYTGFLVQERNGAQKVWLSPRILIKVKAETSDGQRLLTQLQSENDPKKLADVMEKRHPDLDINWEAPPGPARPYEVPVADLAAEKPPERLVRAA